MRGRRRLFVILSVIMAVAVCFFAGCGGDNGGNENGKTEYTLTFVTNCDDVIAPITDVAGAAITPPAAPRKTDHIFIGWYENEDFSGSAVTIPTVMPDRDVTYYARFEYVGEAAENIAIVYIFNLDGADYGGAVEPTRGEIGDTVTVADGSAFLPDGYKFVGWTTDEDGTVSLTQEKNPGQYSAGEKVTAGESVLVLYAQWARVYTDARGKSSDTICIYTPLIGNGLGAAILVRNGKEDKLGFVTAAENTQTGYAEFEFYFDENEGGDIVGRLYADDHTYLIPDGMEGQYLYRDYVTNGYLNYILSTDGYGFAAYIEIVGSQVAVRASGYYEYDEDYGDYLFVYEQEGDSGHTYSDNFYMEKTSNVYLEVGSGNDKQRLTFDGYFTFLGEESGTFIEYGNGEIDDDYYLTLNGYGYARLYVYDYSKDDYVMYSEGSYTGTEYYENAYGEWRYVPSTAEDVGFSFILSIANNYPIYIIYDESMYGVFENGDQTLILDGYGLAQYTAAGVSYTGECTVSSGGLVTFVPYIVDDNGNASVGSKLYFNIDRENGTFEMNTEGFLKEGTAIVGYVGDAQIITVPEGITAIGDDAFNCNHSESGVSVMTVTLPSTLTSIGDRAFENNYTLSRVIFTSETPIEIDFTSESWAANNPFRWPSGSFIIVVPEDCIDAYKAAWAGCPYTIKGSVEVTKLPEFEIENNVLIRYNKQPDSADVLDLVIPDGVTEIADGVFMGMTYIRSVDLNDVTKIGDSAFGNCENLVSVIFGSVREIGADAFFGCYGLRTSYGIDSNVDVLELPSIETIGEYAFADCMALRLVRLGESLTAIGSYAFYECNILADDPPLFVELLGNNAPAMGDRVTTGNIAFRFKVKDISVAIDCFNSADWAAYCRHLYIESGAEKGTYVCGLTLLELDGRALLQSSILLLYSINGDKITFYEYDSDSQSYATAEGAITAAGINVTFGSTVYNFLPLREQMTFTSADGAYTLVYDPEAVLTEGACAATFNGKAVQVTLQSYTSLLISSYTDTDGRYDISLTFDVNTLVVKRTAAAYYIRDIACEDGSVINLHFTASSIYIFGELKIKVGEDENGNDVYLTWSDYGTLAQNPSENVYTFTFNHKSGSYAITVTVSDDNTSFTYKYTVN